MTQIKTNEQIKGLNEILIDTGRAISIANLKIYQAIPPLVDYVLGVSQMGKRIPLTAPRKETLPNPKNSQMEEWDVWYEARNGEIEKIVYDTNSDMFDKGATYVARLTKEEFLRWSRSSIDIAREVYTHMEHFKKSYELRDINKRDDYSRFF